MPPGLEPNLEITWPSTGHRKVLREGGSGTASDAGRYTAETGAAGADESGADETRADESVTARATRVSGGDGGVGGDGAATSGVDAAARSHALCGGRRARVGAGSRRRILGRLVPPCRTIGLFGQANPLAQ